jgi:anaerobic magnesium-protoporphyrin IX monomethyl ester cyclase
MKTLLYTTLTSFFSPSQGAARLHAFIRQQGHDISFKDLNQDTYFTLLSREYLERDFDRLTFVVESMRRNKFLRESVGALLIRGSNTALRQLLLNGLVSTTQFRGILNAPGFIRKPAFSLLGNKLKEDNLVYALLKEKEYVISEVDRARKVLDEHFYALPAEDFLKNFEKLLCGKALIDAVHFPTQMDFGLGLHGMAYAPCVADIRRAVNDEKHNFLLPYYRDKVLPMFREEQPGLVGISVSHVSEFIPAFTLANLIRKESPETHICLGGAVLTEVSQRVSKNLPLWEYFDSLVIGPGEHVFSNLIETIETQKPLSNVPNLVYRENGTVKNSEKHLEFDLNDACTPEYVSVRPKSVLPLETSSGCYWGRCIFCYYPKEGTADFNSDYRKGRVRNMELVIKDMETLKKKYDPEYVAFTDSSFHPQRLEQIAEHNLTRENPIHFSSFFRFEKAFTSPDFCEKLARGGFIGGQVGLESGSQKINDFINKGVSLTDAETIIRNFYKAGILIHIYSVVGLPGETPEDSRMTRDFMKRWHKMITLGWQIYPLGIHEQGPLAMRGPELGLELTPMADDYLVQVMQYTSKNGMSQGDSMAAVIGFQESLKKYFNPLNNLMDVESHKVMLLVKKSREKARTIAGS